MTTGEKIRLNRERLGMTQSELGALFGIEKSAVNKWEHGSVSNIPKATLLGLCELFEVTPNYLLIDDQPVQEVSAPNSLQVFENQEFGRVRSMCIDGEPWFVGKDVADALGYAETNNMVKRLDDEDFISSKLAGMNMKSILINESGLYSAIIGSQLPSAKKFKRWVTSEVLPAIRKNGQYQVQCHQVKPTTVGDVVNLIKATRQAMKDQGSDPRDIAAAIKQICEQFDIQLPNCFVKPQETNLQDVFNMVDYIYSLPKGKGHAKPTYEDFVIHQATVKMLKG